MGERRIRIAIDGPASSGKGTVARLVARALDYTYVDTGALYRAVGLLAMERGMSLDDAPALGCMIAGLQFRFQWDGSRLRLWAGEREVSDEIRAERVGRAASDVAVLPDVRQALLDRQRDLARVGGVVMDGRDIGTVVLPDAELKVFLDASIEERARRRHAELEQRGQPMPFDQVLRELRERDQQDTARSTAPLRAAADAVYLDTTHLTAQQAADRVLLLARERARR